MPTRVRIRQTGAMSSSSTPDSPIGDLRDSIVVAVDGSDHAARALRWAAEQAFLERRRLVAVAVGDDAGSEAEHAVAAARELHPDLPVRAAALPGDPTTSRWECADRSISTAASSSLRDRPIGLVGRPKPGSLASTRVRVTTVVLRRSIPR